jgi:hypothetical protein
MRSGKSALKAKFSRDTEHIPPIEYRLGKLNQRRSEQLIARPPLLKLTSQIF